MYEDEKLRYLRLAAWVYFQARYSQTNDIAFRVVSIGENGLSPFKIWNIGSLVEGSWVSVCLYGGLPPDTLMRSLIAAVFSFLCLLLLLWVRKLVRCPADFPSGTPEDTPFHPGWKRAGNRSIHSTTMTEPRAHRLIDVAPTPPTKILRQIQFSDYSDVIKIKRFCARPRESYASLCVHAHIGDFTS